MSIGSYTRIVIIICQVSDPVNRDMYAFYAAGRLGSYIEEDDELSGPGAMSQRALDVALRGLEQGYEVRFGEAIEPVHPFIAEDKTAYERLPRPVRPRADAKIFRSGLAPVIGPQAGVPDMPRLAPLAVLRFAIATGRRGGAVFR